MLNIDEILKKASEEYDKSKSPPSLIQKTINLSESYSNSMASVVNRFGKSVLCAYRAGYSIPVNAFKYLEEALYLQDVHDYLINAIKNGKSPSEILKESFSVKRFLYKELAEKSTSEFVKSVFSNALLFEAFETQQNKGNPSYAPVDKEIGNVRFSMHTDDLTKEEKEKRLRELGRLRQSVESKPIPEVLYIPLTLEQARAVNNSTKITEIIAHTQALTYNLDKHIIAVVSNGNRFKPLISHILDSEKIPEQIFSDEYEQWLLQIQDMWYIDSIDTASIMYFIDLISDSFWYEGFFRKWNRIGGGGAVLDEGVRFAARPVVYPSSTETDEFFTDLNYRIDPGNYNSPISGSLTGNLTVDQTSGPYLIATRGDENTGYLAYNSAFSGSQTYYRVFKSQETRPKSNAYIYLGKYLNGSIHKDMIFQNKILIDLKLPGHTGWMSCNKFFEPRGFTAADGQGILMSYERFGPGIMELTFENFSNAYSDFQGVIRITYTDETVEQLSRFSFVNWRSPNY